MIDNGLGVGLLPDRAFALMRGVGRLAAVPPGMTPGRSASCAPVARDCRPAPTARLLAEHLATPAPTRTA